MFNSHNFLLWQEEKEKESAIRQCAFQYRWSINVGTGVICSQSDKYFCGLKIFFCCLVSVTFQFQKRWAIFRSSHTYFRYISMEDADFNENQLPILLDDIPLQKRETLIFQHNGVPHYSRRLREILDKRFPDR